MPELPEAETVRAGLATHVVGRTVESVSVLHPRTVRRQPGGPPELAARLTGRTVTAAVRRGKYLWLSLDDDQALLAHLGMSGQLLVLSGDAVAGVAALRAPGRPAAAPFLADRTVADLSVTRPPSTVRTISTTTAHLRARLGLSGGGELWFVDQRTFGHLLVTELVPTGDGAPGGHGSPVPALPGPVAHIARDLLDPALDVPALVSRTRRRRTEIKRALLDQALVSGVGNIYADEALWRSRLHPTRPTDRLRPAAVRELFTHAAAVMREALAVGGTSFDALYVDVDGAAGYFARSLAVYGRAGTPCPRCGTPVRRAAFMNRSSFFCARCQPLPRRPAPDQRPAGR